MLGDLPLEYIMIVAVVFVVTVLIGLIINQRMKQNPLSSLSEYDRNMLDDESKSSQEQPPAGPKDEGNGRRQNSKSSIDKAVRDNLEVRFDTDQGALQDDGETLKEFLKAAEGGNISACYNLGWMYARGQGVAKDSYEAAKWYQKAAEQGMMAAQLILGMMYASGHDLPQDDAEAVKWLKKAADQGHEIAQSYLSNMIAEGRYQPQNAPKTDIGQ